MSIGKIVKNNVMIFILSFILMFIFSINTKAVSVSITSVTTNGNVLVYVTADVPQGYKLQLSYSEFYDGDYSNVTHLDKYPNELGNDYEFTIQNNKISSGIYHFQAFIRDTRGSSQSYAVSNEVYKEIIKDSSGITINDYYPPDPSDNSRPVEYINASSKDKTNISKLMNKFFKNAKNYNVNGMRSCLKTVPKDSFIGNGDVKKFIRNANKKHLRFKIRKVVVAGKKAKVTMDVGFYDASDDLEYAIKKQLNSKSKKLDIKTLVNTMKKSYKSGNEQKRKSITINLVKHRGKWKIKTFYHDLQIISDCKIIETINDLQEHPLRLLL